MSYPSSDRPFQVCPGCGTPVVAGSILCKTCGRTLVEVGERAGAATGPIDPGLDIPLVFAPGQAVAERYTIVERAGAGGMGLIYKALDRKLGRTVALKLIQAGVADRPGARERFTREMALAQQVTHPNVCRVHDLGEIEGQPFISMEYVEGQTLETLVQSMGHLSPSQTVAIAKQAAAGLQAIHERGIVHRDLKPSNVMVDRLGHVVLMDFGMAYHEDQARLTQAGAVFGTLAYLAPEQARGKADARSDLYALGLLLYEMLTGRRPPGDGGSLPLALRGREEPCPGPSHFSPEVPLSLDALVMRCLEREPAARYASARALLEVTQQFEGDLTRSGLLTRPMPEPVTAPRRTWLWRGAALAAVVATAALFGFRMATPAAPPPPMSIAFLPLSYTGSDENSYLKNLLPLVLSQELQNTPGLTVTPFAVSRTYGADEDPRSVARQLGVSVVVKGAINAAAGTDASIGFRAVTADGKEAWTEKVAGSMTTVFERTGKLSRNLSRALGFAVPALATTRSAEALKQYTEGMTLLEGWDVPQSDVRAVQAFETAIARAPDFAEAHAGLARAYLNEYDRRKEASLVDKAAGAAERSATLSPSLPEAHLALGLVYLWRGRSAEATAELEKAQQLAPADDTVCRRIANAYARMSRAADAERWFKRAIELRPGYWHNYNGYGSYLLRGGKLKEAEDAFQHVIELRPESSTGYSNLAATLVMAGRPAEAEPFLVAALKIQPSEATHNNLGFVYYTGGHFDLAAKQWEAAIAFGSERAEHYSNLGDAYRHLLRTDEASRAYKRGVELFQRRLAVDPSDVGTRAVMAMALAGRGDCAEALAQVRQARAFETDQPYVAYYAAVAAALCNRPAEAERLTLRAITGGAVADVRTNPDLKTIAEKPLVQARLGGMGAPVDRPR
jgi:eukaryotic-like serine/threonine-protein kinase